MSSFYFWHWRICVLMRLNKGAFYDCISLTSITIPNGVTSIGDRAVAYCYKLETITFKGTEEQWNAITKGTNWDSGAGQSTSDRKYKLVFEK